MNRVHVEAAKNLNIAMDASRSIRLVMMTLLGVFWINAIWCQGSLNEDSGVSAMLKAYARLHKSKETVKAWRIQVLASSDRRHVEQEKERFENIYPYLRLDLVHDNPYYIIKLRDVAYREKMDALHLLHRIKRRYPAAILVLDDVKPEKLLSSEK